MRPDPWLAERLGLPVFTVEEQDVRFRERAFYQAKVPCDALQRVHALEDDGFRVVDVNVTLERPAGPLDTAGAVPVADARPEHRAGVLALAEHDYTVSRFHLDPEIPDGVAGVIKRDWAAAVLDGERGERMLVAGDAQGFLAVTPGPTIDLIAVRTDARGSGIGRALVAALAPAPITVGTQVANTGALRFYERLGFSVTATRFVLHRHP